MNGKRFAFLSTLTTAFTVVALAPQSAAGQDRAGGTETPSTAAASPWTVPPAPDGQPDLQGVWVNTSATPFERPQALEGRQFLTDDEVAELSRRADRIFKENDADLAIGDALFLTALADVDAFRRRGANRSSNFMVEREFDNRTSQIVDPPDGKLPMLMPAAVERWAALTARDVDPAGPSDLQHSRPLPDAGDAAHRPRPPGRPAVRVLPDIPVSGVSRPHDGNEPRRADCAPGRGLHIFPHVSASGTATRVGAGTETRWSSIRRTFRPRAATSEPPRTCTSWSV